MHGHGFENVTERVSTAILRPLDAVTEETDHFAGKLGERPGPAGAWRRAMARQVKLERRSATRLDP